MQKSALRATWYKIYVAKINERGMRNVDRCDNDGIHHEDATAFLSHLQLFLLARLLTQEISVDALDALHLFRHCDRLIVCCHREMTTRAKK